MLRNTLLAAAAVGTLALGLSAGGTAGAQEAGAPPANGCRANSHGTTDCYVYPSGGAPSFHTGNVPAGHINHGWNYFYCQAVGSTVTYGGHHNKWWAKTDDDSGNKNVWVNVVYLSGGADDQRVPGLRDC
ncbi:hypothetical protein ACFVW8_23725 [Streptomyces sp. NPDC058221]|uniref:hypothetical protein n=1 Tax=Streptomyces sp. NPDC058221 TaxID=3346388 RepID=UPI0036EB7960